MTVESPPSRATAPAESPAGLGGPTYVRPDMGTVRYIGSKARIVGEILDLIGPPTDADNYFVDAFCGTGSVGAEAANRGWSVRFNDSLRSAVVVSTARLVAAEDVPFAEFGGYAGAIAALNAAAPVKGFFCREYSLAGPAARMYFTEENAARIDATRGLLRHWSDVGYIGSDEHELLIADLISAAGRVANIAGTYGCYLSKWTSTALRPFEMAARKLRPERVPHEAFTGDVVDTPVARNDTVYFDPPYTKRQYAAYYHINETLACGDEPEPIGNTGLRPWKDKASDYCYKSRALGALTSLLTDTPASRVFLSYSSEGHVALPDLQESLAGVGKVQVHELGPIGRYRPNVAASAAAVDVKEFVIELCKASVGGEVVTA